MYIIQIKKCQVVFAVARQQNKAQEAENPFSTEKLRKYQDSPPISQTCG